MRQATPEQVKLAEKLFIETASNYLDVSRMTRDHASELIDRLKARKKELGIR